MPFRRRGFWIVVVALLGLNWLSVLVTRPGGEPRVTVPFSPYFLNHLKAGDVKPSLVEGRTPSRARLPVRSATPRLTRSTSTTRSYTEAPTFWSDAELTSLLQSRSVQVNAKSNAQGTSLLEE